MNATRSPQMSVAAAMALILLLGLPAPSQAQDGCGVPTVIPFSGGARDYSLPIDAAGTMTFTCIGGSGGDASISDSGPFGPYEICRSNGGRAAQITATFGVGNGPNDLAPGGTLRFIAGAAGQSGATVLGLPVAGEYGGGGGGTALLYRAPGVTGNTCQDWTILMVAGGGGGAHQGAFRPFCLDGFNGGNASLSTSGSNGGGPSAGTGGANGAGGNCGEDVFGTTVSGGGGGALGAGQSCGGISGGAGCPNGAGAPSGSRRGGYGFGAGGSGNSGGGGGGGGYSGGGGGSASQQGGGGGSFVSPLAISQNAQIRGSAGNGVITWSATPNFFVNDVCSEAIPIENGTYIGCNQSATQTFSDPPCALNHDVWYAYTNNGACDRLVTARLFDPTPNIIGDIPEFRGGALIVLDGCGGNVIACQSGGTLTEVFSTVSWEVPAGATHYIAVSGRGGDRGKIRLDVSSSDSAIGNIGAPASVVGTNVGGAVTSLSSCFNSVDSPEAIYPYVNTTGRPETVTASTCVGTDFDTVVSVHEACSGTQVVCASDSCGQGSQVTWTAEPNVRYLIRVAGEAGATGNFQLDVNASPVNDTCANALSVFPKQLITGNFVNASASGTGGDCAGGGERDLWYRYTLPSTLTCPGGVRVNVGTALNYEIFTDCGTPLGDVPACISSQFGEVVFLNPGDSFLLRVSLPSVFGVTSQYSFSIDDFSDFGYTGGDSGLPSTSNIGLNDWPQDPNPFPSCGNAAGKGRLTSYFQNSLGYPVRLRADTCGPHPTDTVLWASILTSPDVCSPGFTELACNDNSNACSNPLQSQIFFDVQPGEEIDITVGKNTNGNASANLTIALDGVYPPANDDCVNAQPIQDGVSFGANTTATLDGVTGSCLPSDDKDIWYSYNNPGPCPLLVTVDACNTQGSAKGAFAVFDQCGGTELACDASLLGCPSGARITWRIDPGDTHLIRYSSPDGVGDLIRLNVSSELIDPLGFGLPGQACSARNDLCTNALQVTEGSLPGTLANATYDINPSCASGGDLLADVWYSYTNRSICTATVTASTCLFANASEFRSLAAYDSCGGTELACNSGSADPNDQACAEMTWSVPPGATHLIRVSGVQGQISGDEFTLTIESISDGDRDGDGIEDACDNCIDTPSADQSDDDGDGFGNPCDVCDGGDDALDADGDAVPDACDVCPGSDDTIDPDGDGVPTGCDACPNDNPDDVDGNGTCGGQVVIQGNLVEGQASTSSLNRVALSTTPCDVSNPGAYDFWTFQANAGDVLYIELDRLDPGLDPTFSIWQGDLLNTPLSDFTSPTDNNNQTLVAVGADIEPPATVGNGAPTGSGSDPTLVGTVIPSTGTYTLLVAGNCDSPASANTYELTLHLNAIATIRNINQNRNYTFLQAAMQDALSGDIIEISEGFLFDAVTFIPNGLDVTIRGAGRTRTFIDTEGQSATLPLLIIADSGQTSATVIEDLTIQKNVDISGARGAIWIQNTSPTLRNVGFTKNYGNAQSTGGIDVTIAGASANPTLENCTFFNGQSGGAALELLNGADATLINCVFDQSQRSDLTVITAIDAQDGTLDLVNCTVEGPVTLGTATVNAVNSIFADAPPVGTTLSRCLFPTATGNNIDGAPVYRDPSADDYRLAAASLGIDAADYAAYLAGGGGNLDAGGQLRTFDDPNTPDTGSGALTYLDIGAFEYFLDSDGDGVGDGSDVCPGFDDNVDSDGDGTPDGCDPCPIDANNDSDGDGVCDSADICPGADDNIDSDGDGTTDCAELAGDDCPQFEQVGNGTVTGSLQNYAGDTGDDSSCGTNDTIDRWFRYNSTVNGSLLISTCNPGTQFDTILSVFDGCPESGGQEITCVDNSSPTACTLDGSTVLSEISLPVNNGDVFYIRLSAGSDDFAAFGGASANYELTILAEGDGDICENALLATAGSNTGTLADNAFEFGDQDSCGIANEFDDEWLLYTPTVSGLVTFSTCNANTGFDTTLSIWDACPSAQGTELACNDDGPGGICDLFGERLLSQIELNVTAGNSYYIRVAANFSPFEPGGPEYDLVITEPSAPPCSGDTDADGDVDLSDLALLLSQFGQSGPGLAGDTDGDGDVDLSDLAELLANFGQSC